MKKEEDFLRDSYKGRKNAAMGVLHAHLGNRIVITGTWAEAEGERELDEEELLEGEISASVFTIGCYTVRIADCLYMDGKGVNDMYRIPAARYCSGSSELVDHWQNICMAAQTHRGIGSESIDYICTVKRCHAVSDGQAVLFVLRRYWGDSYTSESWYKFTPDGRAESYHIHGYGQDDTDVWKL